MASLEKKRAELADKCRALLDADADRWDEASQRRYDRYIDEIDKIDRELYGMSSAALARVKEHIVDKLHAEDPREALLAAADRLVDLEGGDAAVSALRDLADEIESTDDD